MNESGSVNIPSGTYDIGIMNPDPDGGLYSEGTIYIIELLGHTGDDFEIKEGWDYEFHVFNYNNHDATEILPAPPHDAAITSIEWPVTSPDLSASETIRIKLKNNGKNIIASNAISLSYSIDNGVPVEENFNQALEAGQETIHEFSTKADLSRTGSHHIEVTLSYPQDEYADNNSLSLDFQNIAPIASFPLTQTFDSAASVGIAWQIIDHNQDGVTWTWSSSENGSNTDHPGGSAFYEYSFDLPADDYLLSPPLRLPQGKANIAFLGKVYSKYNAENIEIYFGQGLDVEQYQKLAVFQELTQTEWEPFHANADIEQEGIYYFATCDEPLDPYSLDFESCNDFMMDHFNPQWISVNEDDNEHNYGLSGYEWPNAYAAGAFIAFNPSQATPSLEDVADPHAGNKFGASFSSPEGASNDWLISPKLSMPDNARLRLWTKSFKANEYTERFNILISTTDNSPESFIQIGQTHQAGADWEETVVDLTQVAFIRGLKPFPNRQMP